MPETDGSLLAHTRRLLRERIKETSLLQIHMETGLSYYWLRKITNGETEDPSVNKIQALYEYLSGQPLLPEQIAKAS